MVSAGQTEPDKSQNQQRRQKPSGLPSTAALPSPRHSAVASSVPGSLKESSQVLLYFISGINKKFLTSTEARGPMTRIKASLGVL